MEDHAQEMQEDCGRFLRDVQAIAGLGIYVLDIPTGSWKSSEVLDEIFGLDASSEHSIETWIDLLHADDRQAMVDYFSREVVGERRPFDREYRILRRCDGTQRWVHGRGRLDLDAQGLPVRMIGTIQDITARKRAADDLRCLAETLEQRVAERTRELEAVNAALRGSHALLNETGKVAHVGGWELDLRTSEQVWTDEVYRIHEVEPGFKPTMENGIAFYTPESRPIIERLVRRAMDEGEPFDEELQIVTARGRRRWVRAVGRLDGERRVLFGIFQDINTRKHLDLVLREKNVALDRSVGQLRKLAGELTQAEERERKRLAGQLHDNLQPLLVACTLKVGLLDPKAGEKSHARAVQEILDLLRESLDASRVLTMELYPPVLLDAGLVPGLRWLSDWMLAKHGLRVALTMAESPDIPEPLTILVFRAVRELLLNVVKHAEVPAASVSMEWPTPGALRVVVSDQGRGFNPGETGDPFSTEGFGLFHLREHLAYVGGTLDVASAPGQGTTISMTVPFAS
jgi:PAS domain S-box-containing protein